MDGDGQGVASRAAVAVIHGIGEGVGQRVPGIQALHGGQGIVEDVCVGAVGIEGQGAVRTRLGDLGREGKDVAGNAVVVRVLRGGERAGDQSLHVFRHIGRGRRYRRIVVDAVDGHGEGIGPGSSVSVRHRVGEGIGQGLPFAQPLHGGQTVVQGIGVVPVGVEVQGTEQASPGRNGDETYGVADVRVAGRGQYAGSRARGIFGDGSRSRSYDGQIVDAVNGDGQRGGSGGPVVVRDLIGYGVGEGRPYAKLPHGVRRVVQRVGP